MIKKIVTALFCFINIVAFPQAWKVDYAAYQFNMTMTGIICLDYVNATDSTDLIGAFVNEECRGFASPVFNSDDSTYYADLVVYGNDNDEEISFRVYTAKTGTTTNLEKTVKFEINKITGSRERPYFWANPALSSEVAFQSFKINGQVGETEFIDSTVVLHFAADFQLYNAVADFEVPELTKVLVKKKSQISGESRNDFNDTIMYTIIAADRSGQKNWYVTAIKEVKLQLDAVNTITPNGDGVNDYFTINNLELYEGYELTIFSSVGLKIFSSKNYQNEWNGTYKGKTLSSGVYHYIFKKGDQVLSGTISLLK